MLISWRSWTLFKSSLSQSALQYSGRDAIKGGMTVAKSFIKSKFPKQTPADSSLRCTFQSPPPVVVTADLFSNKIGRDTSINAIRGEFWKLYVSHNSTVLILKPTLNRGNGHAHLVTSFCASTTLWCAAWWRSAQGQKPAYVCEF